MTDILNQSLFICYSTPNYAEMTKLFLKSLNNIGVVSNIDHKIDYPDSSLMTTSGFRTPLWYHCIEQKLIHLVNTLKIKKSVSTIKYFISTDCDIIFIQKNIAEWKHLEYYINSQSKDIFYMRESSKNEINGGFYIIKNNANIDKIITFIEKIIEELHISMNNNDKITQIPLADQSIINNLKETINYGYIPNEYVIWATDIYNVNKSLFHHAVCTHNIAEKIEQINYVKDFFK